MDLSEDFINIQGIVQSFEQCHTKINKLKYRGGNEKEIDDLIRKLHKYLTEKHYFKNDEVNPIFTDKLKDIVTFLILNTETKIPFDEPCFQHLIGIMPNLSKCALANIVVELGLCKIYCDALQRFDLNITTELLEEMLQCLKRAKPVNNAEYAYFFLELITIKVSVASPKVIDDIEKITELASQLLLSLGGFFEGQVSNLKKATIDELIGLNLLNILNLLLLCVVNDSTMKLIDKFLRTCHSILMAITVDVFVSWAELEKDDKILQVSIAEKAFSFIEKYKNYKFASEVAAMLAPIAQKPKTISEQILCADTPTIVSMINKGDANQKQWFQSLLNSQVFNNEESMECVERWANLCVLEDVTRLLSMALRAKNSKASKIAAKCAATLETDDLVLAITRYFHENGLSSTEENIQQDLVVLFNKIEHKSQEDEFTKSLHLLLLKNPKQTLAFIFGECLKRSFCSKNLRTVFPTLIEVARIDEIGTKILIKVISENELTTKNCKNYVIFLNVLIDVNFYKIEQILELFLLQLLLDGSANEDYQTIKFVLEITNNLNGSLSVTAGTEPYYTEVFRLLKTCRCNFFQFNNMKYLIIVEIVDIIEKLCENSGKCDNLALADLNDQDLDFFTVLYKQRLFQHTNVDIFDQIGVKSLQNHVEVVAVLIKILSLCVTKEWILITKNLLSKTDVSETIELLCDAIILISDVVNSLNTNSQRVQMLDALKCIISNFGVAIKKCVQPAIKFEDQDVGLTKNMCRVLANLPTELLPENGFFLANILSRTALMALKEDKKFACLVVSIDEAQIRKFLAHRILNQD